MTELAEVFLWGGRIGFVSLSDNSSASEFEYDKSFVGAGVDERKMKLIEAKIKQNDY